MTKTTLISANAVFPRGIQACVERCSKSKLVLSITQHSFKTILQGKQRNLRFNADFCEDVVFYDA
ncbi:hypothetical protein KFK09_023092 [Dendrobium nobile]|uniref:Uncharacterized protein n=1 Tax=Dendrobium nobile TaxID=94219 RepID=A0A8T3AL64_DENNO|nr:hypothetical protein KFK09_023092 [Dendrobium nobile]